MTDSIFGTELEVIKAEATTAKPKMIVKNVVKLSDEAMTKKLRDHGVEVPDGSTRLELIVLLKTHNLWNYKGNIIAKDFKRKYAANGGSCGDLVSQAFGPMEDTPANLERLRAIAEANEIKFDRWSHCNFGQKKMNLGNVLRGMIKRGEDNVIIETTEWIKGELVMLHGEPVETGESEAEA